MSYGVTGPSDSDRIAAMSSARLRPWERNRSTSRSTSVNGLPWPGRSISGWSATNRSRLARYSTNGRRRVVSSPLTSEGTGMIRGSR